MSGHVVVTGATGFVGKPLCDALAQTRQVVALVRDPRRAQLGSQIKCVAADLESTGPWQGELAGAAAVVHLAGEPIAEGRWDARKKQRIRESRVESSRVLVEAIAALDAAARPKALLAASGIDYYPTVEIRDNFDDDEFAEHEDPGTSFLARVCRDWEAEIRQAATHGVRTASFRIGVVLGPGGGAMAKLVPLFRKGLGGPLGSGKQWFSWISHQDLVGMLISAIDDPRFEGPINAVAPGATRQREFAAALGRACHRPAFLPAPGFAIKLAVGAEFAESLLEGRKVVPRKLLDLGYPFTHPTVDSAIAAAL